MKRIYRLSVLVLLLLVLAGLLLAVSDATAQDSAPPDPIELILGSGQLVILRCEGPVKARVVGSGVGEAHVQCSP